MASLLAYLGVSALPIVTPGQDTALTIRNTLAGGRRAGVRTAFGVSSGQAIWALAAAAGLAAILQASEPAFLVLGLVGAAYLIYLGVRAPWSALQGAARRPSAARRGAPYRQGLLSVIARAGDVLRSPRVRRVIDAVTGAVLVAFGARLAAERS